MPGPGIAAEADRRFMDAAFTLARRGLGRVWPNPSVGCVIVAQGRIAGRGWTQPGGRPHAEAMALAQAGDAARGATAYITLEPCAHHGQTPPCADALVTAGIARVVSTVTDPDPRVSGGGFARLRAAGVEVLTGLAEREARAINAGFFTRLTEGRPAVTLKLAATLDGRIATARGESRWITSPEARRFAHLQRARHDGVLVGAGTVRADDPLLDVRDIGFAEASPVRVVADGTLGLDPGTRLVQSAGRVPLWVAHLPGADPAAAARLAAEGVVLLPCPADPADPAGRRLDLAALLALLAARGLTRLFCEGGAELAAALVRGKLVDRLLLAQAGRAIGGDGLAALGPLGIDALADVPAFELAGTRRLGPDLLSEWTARRASAPPEG